MPKSNNPILILLADGRIDPAEAERLLEYAGSHARLSSRLLAWLPVLVMIAILLFESRSSVWSGFEFLSIRAAEMARIEHFHLLLNI